MNKKNIFLGSAILLCLLICWRSVGKNNPSTEIDSLTSPLTKTPQSDQTKFQLDGQKRRLVIGTGEPSEIQRNYDEVATAGLPESLADLQQDIPDEVNAAFELKQIFAIMDKDHVVAIISQLREVEWDQLSSEDKGKLLAKFDDPDMRKILELAQKATLKEKVNYGVDYSQGVFSELSHLAKMRRLCEVVVLNSRLHAELGSSVEAFRNVVDDYLSASY